MLDEGHLRESLLAHVVPPPLAGLDFQQPLPAHAAEPPASLVRMGFPQRVSLAASSSSAHTKAETAAAPGASDGSDGSNGSNGQKERTDHSLCFCHGIQSLIAPQTQQASASTQSSALETAGAGRGRGEERELYVCPQCLSKYCALPAECGVCGLVLVAAPLLSRAFRHLFPLAPFAELHSDAHSTTIAQESDSANAGDNVNPSTDSSLPTGASRTTTQSEDGLDADRCYGCLEPFAGQQLRTRCDNCKHCFCPECDVALHQSVQSCPGCCAAGISLALT